jgi:antitoxin VapB
MTEAVTAALRERLEREQARRLSKDDLAERIAALVERFSGDYDGRPVSRAEWNWASGDED